MRFAFIIVVVALFASALVIADHLDVSGTEYIPGDTAKIFLQYLDSDNKAVNNTECFVKAWYPNGTIVSTLNNSLMSKLDDGSDGVYYKNYVVPNVTGVYPVSAKCYRPLDFANQVVYAYAFDGWESNTWTGGTGGWSTCGGAPGCQEGWDYEDTVPLATIVATGCKVGTYCAKYTGSYGYFERGVDLPEGTHAINITFWFKFKGFQNMEHGEFFIFDGNWHLEKQFGPNALYGSYTNEVWYQVSIYITETSHVLRNILVGFYTKDMPSTSDEIWIDNLTIDVIAPNISISNETEYTIVQGGSEMHVSNLYNQLSGSISSLNASVYDTSNASLAYMISQMVWNQSSMVFVGGTEYVPGSAGQVVVRILSQQPVSGATCRATVAYPNNTVFINSSPMTEQTGIAAGVYSLNFTVPSTLGVYPYSVDCTKGGQPYYALNTFHVSTDAISYLGSINTTVANISSTVTSIKNDTSLLAQIWTWVQSIFSWVGTDTDANASTAVVTPTVQRAAFISSPYILNANGTIIVEVFQGSNDVPVTTADCLLTVYYPNMTKLLNGVAMTKTEGVYTYSWVPVYAYSYPARATCVNGTLSGSVQASGSLYVPSSDEVGVVMTALS